MNLPALFTILGFQLALTLGLWRALGQRIGQLEQRIGRLERRVDEGFRQVDEQFSQMGERLRAVEQNFAELSGKLEGHLLDHP